MKKDTLSVAMFLAIGFVIAGLFIGVATGMIGDSQNDVIAYTKRVEQY